MDIKKILENMRKEKENILYILEKYINNKNMGIQAREYYKKEREKIIEEIISLESAIEVLRNYKIIVEKRTKNGTMEQL